MNDKERCCRRSNYIYEKNIFRRYYKMGMTRNNTKGRDEEIRSR